MRIFVGNLSYDTSEADLRQLFEEHGAVVNCQIVNEKDTGRSRGFGFVEMSDKDAEEAIEALDETSFGGRNLTVNQAKEKTRGGGRAPRDRGR